MFERFTDRARRVVVMSNEFARDMRHGYIGTEHLLLGLIHEAEGIAGRVLAEGGVGEQEVRAQIEDYIGLGNSLPVGHVPFTQRAKKVLELSLFEARELGHNYIGTEHLLLGMIREGEGVALQVLVKLGFDPVSLRSAVENKMKYAPVNEQNATADRLVIQNSGLRIPTSKAVTDLVIRAGQLAGAQKVEIAHLKQALQELEGAS